MLTSFAISVSVGLACRGCSTFECLKCVGQFESGRMQAPFSGLERRLNCRRIVAVERKNAMQAMNACLHFRSATNPTVDPEAVTLIVRLYDDPQSYPSRA